MTETGYILIRVLFLLLVELCHIKGLFIFREIVLGPKIGNFMTLSVSLRQFLIALVMSLSL